MVVAAYDMGAHRQWFQHRSESCGWKRLYEVARDRGPRVSKRFNPCRVTVASFGDLGYVVDEGGADAFQLNFSAAPRAVGEEVEMFPLGDDIWRGTIYLLDEEGRVRGVLQ